MSETPTGIPITDCDTCGKRHPVTRTHCPVCELATLFGHGGCEAPDNPKCVCGHMARDHHGEDGRERPDAGCLAISAMRDDWCRCPRTCADVQALDVQPLALFEVTQ